ncbi:NAD(P)-dependent dehydrogenase (short-subunit alcohol dehydrogenase family) [Duganella sp. 1224]|uniref:SDR family NAD(P)-dependent oxidoreductase n=1 Tax=Duganella sp. 1224 TaxID=2587052 RepID=UPI0015C75B52|nr:SDR family oxidoreductase [Duganella sp. 1224]NYE60490.1 NAD(P)-dependent dehydrogenase (short-subunit alcohol dehydrogenase family) [Duganella sp. 1224]
MGNRIALITGGSRGLGKSAAQHLARAGWDVVITYQARADAANDTVAEVRALGRKAVALQLDTGATAGFSAFKDAFAAVLESEFGRQSFDALINNAGGSANASFAETTEQQFDELMNVHLKGVFFLTQALLPLLADGGSILNISSGLARFSFPGKAAYAVMKGGVEVLTRYLAKELGERRIRVNTLAPGAIATDFSGGVVRDNPQVNAHVAANTALGRVGLPDDIGSAVAALLSDDTAWFNGQRIEASGGVML